MAKKGRATKMLLLRSPGKKAMAAATNAIPATTTRASGRPLADQAVCQPASVQGPDYPAGSCGDQDEDHQSLADPVTRFGKKHGKRLQTGQEEIAEGRGRDQYQVARDPQYVRGCRPRGHTGRVLTEDSFAVGVHAFQVAGDLAHVRRVGGGLIFGPSAVTRRAYGRSPFRPRPLCLLGRLDLLGSRIEPALAPARWFGEQAPQQDGHDGGGDGEDE